MFVLRVIFGAYLFVIAFYSSARVLKTFSAPDSRVKHVLTFLAKLVDAHVGGSRKRLFLFV